MINDYTIPPEIFHFFSVAKSNSLLVKGFPGTGKTIFSLQCVSNLKNKTSGIYFSTRVDAKSLYEHFPWIKEQIPSENVVDATKNITPKEMDLACVINYSSLPDFLKGLYSIVYKISQQQTPLIIVDSIDALAVNVRMPVEETCSRLVNFAESMNSQMIIVTERYDISTIDYIVDGVIKLERKFLENRLLRRMRIEKLRGTEIRNPTYYFTLRNGKFQYFKRLPTYHLINRSYEYDYHPPIRDGEGTKFFNSGKFSFGTEAMDEVFNGVRRGSLILFEVDDKMNMEDVITVTFSIVENFLTQKRYVIMSPSENLHSDFLFRLLNKLVGEEITSKYFQYLDQILQYVEQGNSIMKIQRKRILKYLTDAINKLKVEHRKHLSSLLYLFIDTLESITDVNDVFRVLSSIAAKIKVEGDLCVTLKLVSGRRRSKYYRKIADVVIKLFTLNGVTFLYGIKPVTKLYNVNVDLTHPHPKLVLTPIV